MEGAFDEFKTHLKGARRVLRSETPELVRQEVYGLLLAHYAVRGLMHEAALSDPAGPRDPDTLSFTHAVRVIRRTLPPSGPAEGVAAPARGDPGRATHRARGKEPRPRRAARPQAQDS